MEDADSVTNILDGCFFLWGTGDRTILQHGLQDFRPKPMLRLFSCCMGLAYVQKYEHPRSVEFDWPTNGDQDTVSPIEIDTVFLYEN